MVNTEITKERLSEFFYPSIGWCRTTDHKIVDYVEIEINPSGIKKLEDNLERCTGNETKEQNPWLFDRTEEDYEHIIAYVHFIHDTTVFDKIFIEVITFYGSEPLEVENLINEEEKQTIISYAEELLLNGKLTGRVSKNEKILYGEKIEKTLLYNAITLLINETFEQYDDSNEWFDMILNELGTTKEQLEDCGIEITVDGGLSITST